MKLPTEGGCVLTCPRPTPGPITSGSRTSTSSPSTRSARTPRTSCSPR